LSQLSTISWDVFVDAGYIAHVDVIIDIDGDGVRDDALVFEYDKVQTPSDQLIVDMNFQRDAWVNTFDDKGIVNDDAIAWLSSGLSGGLNSPGFINGLLSLWKSGIATDIDGSTVVIDGSTVILGFEIEIDSWIIQSDDTKNPISTIRNIQINGMPVEVSLQPLDSLEFNVETEFAIDIVPNIYTITTTVDLR